MHILALIPARGGSKGIPNKNIKPLHCKPLIEYTIDHVRGIKDFDFVAVSSDSQLILDMSANCSPFIHQIKRPARFASDKADMTVVMKHALEAIKLKDYVPDMLVLFQPTSPLRSISTTIRAIRTFSQWYDDYDSLVPLTPCDGKVGSIVNNIYRPVYQIGKNRQELNQMYKECGNIFIFKPKNILNNKPYGKRLYPFIIEDTKESLDIDTMDDWEQAEKYLEANE